MGVWMFLLLLKSSILVVQAVATTQKVYSFTVSVIIRKSMRSIKLNRRQKFQAENFVKKFGSNVLPMIDLHAVILTVFHSIKSRLFAEKATAVPTS